MSKSGYYQWLKHADEKPKDYDDYLLIKDIFSKGKQKYGWRQVKMNLKRQKKIVMYEEIQSGCQNTEKESLQGNHEEDVRTQNI